MKRILITTVCFISFINAADDTKKITLQFDGKSYKGYYLDRNESEEYSFIGHTTVKNIALLTGSEHTHTIIAALCRDQEHYEQFSLPLIDVKPNPGVFGGADYVISNPTIDSMYKALVLCNLYIKTDAQRTLNLETKSISKSESSKE